MLAVAAAVASAGIAQAQAGPPIAHPRGEGRGPGGRGGQGMGPERMLLKGITLSETQKSELKQLMDTQRAQTEQERGQGRGNFEALRTARANGDTATVRRLMEEQRTRMDTRRDQQVAAIRAILTSDQLATFDANVAEMKKRQAEMGPGMRGRGGPGGAGGRSARP